MLNSLSAKTKDNNSNNKPEQINQIQLQEMITIEPSNVIVFYRNQFQSASTIKITKDSALNRLVKFQLKTTNKAAYLVSQSSGQLPSNQVHHYINILINQQIPLEQCLHDKFKLLILVDGFPPIEKKFKVIIDYKKQGSKILNKDLQRLEVVSKTSGNGLTSTPTLMAHPTALKKSMLKKSQLVSYLGNSNESDRVNIKEELDQVVKKVQEKRLRLEYLQKQIQRKKSRQRLMLYGAIFVIIVSLLLGISIKKLALTGFAYASNLQY